MMKLMMLKNAPLENLYSPKNPKQPTQLHKSPQWPKTLTNIHGEFTPFQVEHHVWTKFATPRLHAIDNFKN